MLRNEAHRGNHRGIGTEAPSVKSGALAPVYCVRQPTRYPTVLNTTAKDRPLRLVQISDCHLGADAGFRLAGLRPWHSFHEVLAHLARQGDIIDRILVTGDIAADGAAPAYRLFGLGMNDLGLPYNWLPGNHDDFGRMKRDSHLPPFEPLIALGHWRLLCLNTAVPGAVGGFIDRHQLASLEAALDTLACHPVAIFMHHPPASIGCRWLDRQQVANGEALAAILRRQRMVKALFSGHVHQPAQVSFAGLPLYTAPSTSVQFAPGSDDFALAQSPPAFRWVDFHENGDLITGITTIDDSGERVDLAAGGY